jgi:hypothetical protein
MRQSTLHHPYLEKQREKNITVSKAMIQNKWISQVSPIQLIDELHEFITLWEGVSTVNRV